MTHRPHRFALLLIAALAWAGTASAQSAGSPPPGVVSDAPSLAEPVVQVPVAPPTGVRPLPPMQFYSSIGEDTIYDLLKADPSFANMDKELAGTPLFLMVTHTIKPTAGGNAAGLFTGILAGSTLGLIPIVTNEEFVVRYEIWLQGRPIATYSFSRTKTRAINMWTGGGADNYGLGKEGLEWLKSTAGEFAAKAARDPKLAEVQAEIDYYFPPVTAAAS